MSLVARAVGVVHFGDAEAEEVAALALGLVELFVADGRGREFERAGGVFEDEPERGVVEVAFADADGRRDEADAGAAEIAREGFEARRALVVGLRAVELRIVDEDRAGQAQRAAGRAAPVGDARAAGESICVMVKSGKERRVKPRFNAELPCDLTPGGAQLLNPDDRLECLTRDLSETGVGVVANTIYVGYICVVDEGGALRLRLALPSGEIEMGATAAHYIRLDSGADPVYLIGLRITSMSEENRALYDNYLEELSRIEESREP